MSIVPVYSLEKSSRRIQRRVYGPLPAVKRPIRGISSCDARRMNNMPKVYPTDGECVFPLPRPRRLMKMYTINATPSPTHTSAGGRRTIAAISHTP